MPTLFSGVTEKRQIGTDIHATVNGVVANGKGNILEINTATLDLKTSWKRASKAFRPSRLPVVEPCSNLVQTLSATSKLALVSAA